MARANKQLFFLILMVETTIHFLKKKLLKRLLDNVKSKYQEYLKGTEKYSS